MRTSQIGLVLVSFVIAGSTAFAQNDKSMYTLFRQTPRSQMRELTTDRPDKTESPITVDAGHFQIETDMVTSPRDRVRDNGVETDTQSYDVMVSNLKVGLTNSMDLQLVLTPYHYQSVRAGNSESHTSNFGDTVLRLKYNLVGNDGGDFSAGLMPFVKLRLTRATMVTAIQKAA